MWRVHEPLLLPAGAMRMLASTPLAPGHRSWGPTPKVTNSGIKMQSETPKLTCRERGTSNSIKQAKIKEEETSM